MEQGMSESQPLPAFRPVRVSASERSPPSLPSPSRGEGVVVDSTGPRNLFMQAGNLAQRWPQPDVEMVQLELQCVVKDIPVWGNNFRATVRPAAVQLQRPIIRAKVGAEKLHLPVQVVGWKFPLAVPPPNPPPLRGRAATGGETVGASAGNAEVSLEEHLQALLQP